MKVCILEDEYFPFYAMDLKPEDRPWSKLTTITKAKAEWVAQVHMEWVKTQKFLKEKFHKQLESDYPSEGI